jgi:hypothetical protein
VEAYLEAELAESRSAIVTAADQAVADGKKGVFTLDDGRSFEPVLLCHHQGDGQMIVGVAALAINAGNAHSARLDLIAALSRALLNCGAVHARVAAI